MKTFIVSGLLLSLAIGLLYTFTEKQARALPDNSPAICTQAMGDGPVYLALGDSLTHGRVSANYLDKLQRQHKDLQIINAGINSRLAYNVLQNLPQALACEPDFITILVGTNDVNATRSEQNQARYQELWQLPQQASFEFYQTQMSALIAAIKAQTSAPIAVLSIPPIGESAKSEINQKVKDYNGFLQTLAQQQQLTYLPLNQTFWQALQGQSSPVQCEWDVKLMEQAVLRHFVFGQPWNEVAKAHKMHLLTDCIHLNDRGAALVAKLVDGFISPRLISHGQ